MKTSNKVALTLAIIGLAVGYGVYTSVSSGTAFEYFKHVNEVMAEPQAWAGRTLKIHGHIVAGTILKKDGAMDFKFALAYGGKWIDVHYRGIVPNDFKDCAELVVKGKLSSEGQFAGEEISTKCPSKYDVKRQASTCGEELLPQVKAARATRK